MIQNTKLNIHEETPREKLQLGQVYNVRVRQMLHRSEGQVDRRCDGQLRPSGRSRIVRRWWQSRRLAGLSNDNGPSYPFWTRGIDPAHLDGRSVPVYDLLPSSCLRRVFREPVDIVSGLHANNRIAPES